MGYKTLLEAMQNGDFAAATGWTIEVGSGFAIAGGKLTHVSTGSHVAFVGPHCYQALTDMIDPLAYGKKARITVVVDSVSGSNPGCDCHLILWSGGVQGNFNLVARLDAAGTYEATFEIPTNPTVDWDPAGGHEWYIGFYGNNGDAGDTTVISSISVNLEDDDISCVISSAQVELNDTTPIPMTVTFGEAVKGFVAGDVSAVNQDGDSLTVDNVVGSDCDSVYTFDVTPDGDDPEVAIVNIAAGVVARNSPDDGIGNAAAAEFKRTFYGGAAEAQTTSFEEIVE